MDQQHEGVILIDRSLVMYSLMYCSVTGLFAIGVLFKFLTSELRLGFRSILSLVLLFVGEPVCQFVIRGHWGFAGFALGCLVLYLTLPASHLDPKDKAVLITGCDSGFGQALAKRLDALGMQVFATCLNGSGSGAHTLRSFGSSRLQVIEMDVTNEKQVLDVMMQVDAEVGKEGLWGLVNNAGIWYCAEAEMMPWSLFRNVIDVNLMGSIFVTKSFLPLVQRAKGRIVFMNSVVGRFPLPHFCAYRTAMAGVGAFADVLRLEMKKWGVTVALVEPNCFYTESIMRRTEIFQTVWDNMSELCRLKYGRVYFDAVFSLYDQQAAAFPRDLTPVLRAAKSALLSCRPRPRYSTDRSAEIYMWLYAVLPSWLSTRLVETVDVITPQNIVPFALMVDER